MVTMQEFQEMLDEDEFVVGDIYWLQGTRRRFEFTVTNVDPFEPSVTDLVQLPRELRKMVKVTKSEKGKHGKMPRQFVENFAEIPDDIVTQLPVWVRVVRDLCKEATEETKKTGKMPLKRVPRR